MTRIKRSYVGYSWTPPPGGLAPCVVSAVWVSRPRWETMRRIVHSFWVLDYSRSHCGRVRVGSPRSPWLPRGPRIAHLYPPGTPYWEDPCSVRGPVSEAWALFTGGDQAGLGRLIVGRPRFARIVDPAGRIEDCLREMAEAGQSLGEDGFWPAQAAMAQLIGVLGRAERQKDDTLFLSGDTRQTEHERGLVESVNEHFRARLAEKVTLASTARHLGMSESALSHRYAAEAGQPPMAALAALRIELTKSLLLRGLKLDTIAAQAGFFDAFHLSKTFKHHIGLAPSEFRRSFAGRS
jgi:AraC-like DNA-binding protein